jgi:hypothetical protein
MKKLETVKTKAKTVWEKYGKGIVIGVSAGTVGYIAGKYGYSKEIREMIKNLKTFDLSDKGLTIFNDINNAMNGSNYAAVPNGGCKQTLADTMKTMYDHFEINGISPETEITGAVFFIDKK